MYNWCSICFCPSILSSELCTFQLISIFLPPLDSIICACLFQSTESLCVCWIYYVQQTNTNIVFLYIPKSHHHRVCFRFRFFSAFKFKIVSVSLLLLTFQTASIGLLLVNSPNATQRPNHSNENLCVRVFSIYRCLFWPVLINWI